MDPSLRRDDISVAYQANSDIKTPAVTRVFYFNPSARSNYASGVTLTLILARTS